MGSAAGDTTWIVLQSLFQAAQALPAGQREDVLRRAAAHSPACARSLGLLLAAHDSGEFVLDHAAAVAGSEAGDSEDDLIGERIGSYRVVERIGHGALGVVYRAMQEQPRRWVAIKLPRLANESPELLQRLELEAEALGRLQHPSIAQIIEAGTFQRGENTQPFIALELIDGPTVSEFARAGGLSREARIRLLIRICEGVQHAHQRGVIHLDLKPANILVVQDEPPATDRRSPRGSSQPLPKILDFGIARWVRVGLEPQSGTGGTSGIFGTPAYMSPEQLAAAAADVGTRSDVYALGVMAFELLCGRHPLVIPDSVRGLDAVEFARTAPRLSPREALPALPLDLDRIIAKAMHPNCGERYSSAAEFAADLQRTLCWEPVLARRATPLYVLSRFARRHRAMVGGALLAVGALVVGLCGFAWKARDEARQRAAADGRLKAQLQTTYQVVEWVENGLADLPGSTALRLSLAETGLENLATLRAETPASHDVSDQLDYSLAYAHQRLGEVRLDTGEASAARDAFSAALEIRKRQAHQHPTDTRYRRALGVGHAKVADADLALGSLAEAEQHLLRAQEIFEELRGMTGDPPFYHAVYLGLTSQRRGLVAERAAQPATALQQFDLALAHFAAGLRAAPQNILLRRGQVRSLRGRGSALHALGRTAESLAALRDALAECEQLATLSDHAGIWERFQRAETLAALGLALESMGSLVEARAAKAEAARIAGQLVASDARRADFKELRERLEPLSNPSPTVAR